MASLKTITTENLFCENNNIRIKKKEKKKQQPKIRSFQYIDNKLFLRHKNEKTRNIFLHKTFDISHNAKKQHIIFFSFFVR